MKLKQTLAKVSYGNKLVALLLTPVFVFSSLATSIYTYTRTLAPEHAYAATSSNLNFQARIYGSSGNTLPDGYYNIEFKLYNVSSGGSALWTETYYDSNGVTAGNDNRLRVVNGYFSANLGSLTSFPGTINWDQEHWLTLNVGGSTQTATPTYDGEMTPRLKLTAVPYAFRAGQADNVLSSNTNAASTNSAGITIQSGNAAGATSNSGNVTLDVGTATGTTGSISIGTTNTSGITIGRAAITTILQGSLRFSALNCTTFTNGGALTTDASGNVSCSNDDGGGASGVTTVGVIDSQSKSANGAVISGVNIYLQTADGSFPGVVSTGSQTFAGDKIFNGTLTSGTTSALGTISLFDGNSNKTTLQPGNSTTDLTFILPTTVGGANDCLKNTGTAGTLTFANCNNGSGAGGAVTLQDAYDAGNTIATTNARDISFTSANTATDGNFIFNVATGSTGQLKIQSNGSDTLTISASGAVVSSSTITGTTLNGTTGINTGASAGTQRIDSSGNLVNIGNITASAGTTISTGSNGNITLDANGTGTLIVQDAATFNGQVDIAATTSFATKKGTDYTTAGSANNVAISTASLVRLDTSGAAQTITGIVAGRDGQHLYLINVDATLAVTLSNLSGSSSAANQISTGTGADISIAAGSGIELVYDSGASLWRVTSGVAGGNGTCSSCANTALSNLASVAINTALLANADNTIDLGSAAFSFRTLYADTSVLTPSVDVASAGALAIGNSTATSVSICNSAACDTISIGTNADADAIQVGDALDTFTLASTGLNVTSGGALTGVASIDTIATSATALTFAAGGTVSSTSTSAITIDSGTTGNVNLGTGNNAKSIRIGTGTGGNTINIGTDNTASDTIQIGSALDGITIAGTIGLTGATTVSGSNTFTSGTGTVLLQGATDIAASTSIATRKGTDYTTAGSANNVAISTASLYRLDTSGAAQTITGIVAGRDGQILTLVNADTSLAVTLTNNDALSTAANRISTGTGASISIAAGSSTTLIYDTGASLWRVIGGVAGGNGTCSSCANTALSNLSSVAINTALLANADNTIDLGSAAFSFRTLYADTSVLTPSVDVASAGALAIGNTTATSVTVCNSAACDTIQIGTNADADAIQVGDALDTYTLTAGAASTFVINGVTVTATEFNLLDGRDTQLVDTTDAVNTAITGTGALNAGSITSGFGTIDNADTITGTTLNATTGVNTGAGAGTNRIDASGNLVNLGNITATAGTTISTGSNGNVTIDANGTGTFIVQDTATFNGQLDIAATGSLATKKGADYTTAGAANNVALNVASLYRLDTSGAAQDITGIVAGRDGQRLTLINADAALSVTLRNLNGGSSAANQISTGTGADVTLAVGSSIDLIYDTGASLWRVTGGVAGGAGTCTTCANTALSNLASVAINTALLANADNTIDLGSAAFSFRTLYADTSVLTPSVDVASAGALAVGNTTATSVTICNSAACDTISIGTNADADAIQVGDATDTFTLTAGAASTFVINGVTVTATEFNLLDGRDTQLVDTTDAVATAIIGTGALNAGSITSGFGTIDNADTITGTTINGTTGINSGAGAGTQRIDASGNLVNIGNLTASAALTISTGSNGNIILNANGTGIVDVQDTATFSGQTNIAAGTSFATRKAASDYTTPGSANDVAISTASLTRLDTSGAAQTITGIAAGRDGQILTLVNADTSLAVTLTNNDALSAAANRISTGTGASVNLTAGSSISLIYDTGASLWRVIGGEAGGNGTCSSCANTALSNLSSVAINTALLANADNTIDLGSAAFSFRTLYSDTSVLTPSVDVAAAGALALGNSTATSVSICNSAACDTISIGTNADADAIQVGDALDTYTLTAGAASTFIINGFTVDATEFNRLDGKDAALVDANDTLTSTFGTIDTGDTITGTTLNATTGVNTGAGAGTQRIDASGNLVNIGNITATGATTVSTGSNGNIVLNANGTGILDVQDAATFAGTLTINGSNFTNQGSTLNTALALGDFPAGGSIGSAATTVDIRTTIAITQTTAGQTLSLSNPTTATAGRILFILNTGSTPFTMHGVTIPNGYGQTYIWNGSAWILGAAGGGSAITLQSAYDGGNTLTTTNNRNINVTLADTATDANMIVNVASGSTGQFKIQNNGTDYFAVQPSVTLSSSSFGFDFSDTAKNARIGNAEIGAWPASSAFTYFGHQALDHSVAGNYALLQGSSGDTYLNAASGQVITIRNANSTIGTVGSGGMNLSVNGGKTTLQLSNTGTDTGLTIGGDTNLYRSAADVLKTDDDFAIGAYQRTYNLSRAIPSVVNDAIDIGAFAMNEGTGVFRIDISKGNPSTGNSKSYNFVTTWNATNNVWQIVLPTTSQDQALASSDFDLDINGNSGTVSLRLRRTVNTLSAGTALITIYQTTSQSSNAFTPSSTVNSVAAPTVMYGASVINQNSGNLGVGVQNASARIQLAAGTTAAAGILFGTDTNLYRSAADTLKTDDALTVVGLLTGQLGATVTGAAVNLNASSNFATNINTGTSTGAVAIGNNGNATNTVTIDAGTTATGIQIGNSTTAHGIQIGSNATGDNDILLGGANAGSTLTLEGGTAATAIQIGNGATAHGIQIGTGAAVQTVAIGSTNTTSTTTINAGSGNLNLNAGTILGTATTQNLFNTVATTLNIGGAATAAGGGINFAGGSGSTGCSIDGSTGSLTCSAGAAVGSLQASYDGGNTITTTNARNLSVTLADTATDANMIVNVATGSTGTFKVQNNGTDVLSIGSAGQLALGTTGSTGGLLIGGDANLYRSSADSLKTDDDFSAARFFQTGPLTSTTALNVKVTGDGTCRFCLNSDGFINWGDGTALDTSLYRSAANVLGTDDSFTMFGTGSNLTVQGTGTSNFAGNIDAAGTLTAGTSNAFVVNANGTITFNNATTDLTSSSNQSIAISPNGTGSIALTSGATSGDAVNITANSVNTGNALNIQTLALTSGNAINALALFTPSSGSTSTQGYDLFTNDGASGTYSGTISGLEVGFSNNGAVAHTQNAAYIYNGLTGTNTDTTTENLLLIDQADTTATGNTAVTNALNITNSGGSTLTNAITIGSGSQAIGTGINIASTGVTTDIRLQNGETIDNETDGSIVLGAAAVVGNVASQDLFNTVATTLNIGGAVGAGGINLAGGSGSTGCTIDGSNGNLTCSGTISGGAAVTLQSAYDNDAGAPATITTTDADGDIQFILADTTTDANLLVNVATGSTGKFAVQGNGVDFFSITPASNTIAVGNNAAAGSIQIGNVAADKDIIVGNSGNTGSTVTIEGGTAAAAIAIGNGGTAHGIQIGVNSGGDNDISIGSTNAGSTLTLEAGTAASAIAIGNSNNTHGIQIGTGAAVQTVAIGSTNTTSATTIQGGSTGISLLTASAVANASSAAVTLTQTDSGSNTLGATKQGLYVNPTYSGGYSSAIGATTTLRGLQSSPTYSGALSGSDVALDLVGGYFNPIFSGTTVAGSTVRSYGQQIINTSNLGTTGVTQKYGSQITVTGTSGSSTGLSITTAGGVINTGVTNNVTSTSTSGSTEYGISNFITDTGVVASGTDTTYGQQIQVTRNGATGGTINTYGLHVTAIGDNAGAGTSTVTGLRVDTSSSTADTTIAAQIFGGRIDLNVDSNFATNINTGTSTGAVSIGNASNTNNTVTLQAGATGGINLNSTTVNSNAATLALFAAPTTINFGAAVGAGGINFAGGSGSTGCTIDGSNGNLTCSGTISGGTPVTLQGAYDNSTTPATILLSAADDNLLFQNPSSGGLDVAGAPVLKIENLATGNVEGLRVESAGTGNLFTVRDTTATATDVFKIADGGAITTRNQTDSVAAFQIQNAAGTALLTADTTNKQVIVRGPSTDASVGGELFSGIGTCSGTNWAVGATAVHSTGSTVALTCTSPTVTAGATYQIVFDITGSPTAGQTVNPTIGSTVGKTVSGNATTQTQVITASNTGSLTFVPTTNWNGTISNISVKLVTLSNNVLAVQNSSGVSTLEVRSSSSTSNTFIGLSSGKANTSGSNNTAVGSLALQSNTTGVNNSALGSGALGFNSTGQDNTAVGNAALASNTSGSYSVAIGSSALTSNTTGDYNTAIGTSALTANKSGGQNIAIGYGTLAANISGSQNVAVGMQALDDNTSGISNIAIGKNALGANTTSSNSVAIGDGALDVATGSSNTALGSDALGVISSGGTNTGIGANAGNTDGTFATLGTVTNSTALGNAAQVQASNSLILGGQGSNAVKVGIGTTIPTNTLSVSPIQYSTGTAGTGGASSTTVTGSGTTWTTAMVGSEFIFSDGTKRTITAVASTTSLTLSSAVTIANGTSYRIHYVGFQITSVGDAIAGSNILAQNVATNTTGTTEATARTNVTTVTLTAAGNFANNDVIFINNAGQDYYTRITAGGGTTTLTVSPAVSYDVSAAVTKYNIQNIGATATDYTTQNNRFFQGYFLGGIVAGAGSTHYADGSILFQGDTNLYRSAADRLATDDAFLINRTSTQALIVQDASSNSVLTVDTSNQRVGIGSGGAPAGSKLYVSSSTDTVIKANNTGGSNDILSLQRSGTDVVTVNSTGATTLKNSSNSTTAFQIQNAASDTLLAADTTNRQLKVAAAIDQGFTGGSLTTAYGGFTGGGYTNLLSATASFEGASTSGWSVFGTNTGTASSAQKLHGDYSFLATYQNDLRLGGGTVNTLATSTTYTFSAYVYVPNNWNGGQITIGDEGQCAGATKSNIDANMNLVDQWQRITMTLTTAADNTCGVFFRTLSAPTAGRFVYFDNVQITAGATVQPFTQSTSAVSQGLLVNGSATFAGANSTTAFQIQNAAGVSLFTADTSNNIVRPGVSANLSTTSRTDTEISDADNAGLYSSIAIGTDGLPIISHHNNTNLNLQISKCANTSCTSLSSDTEISDADSIGLYSSIAIGTDGLPVISSYNATGGNLQVAKCANTSCTSLSSDTEISDADNVGNYSSIAIGTDGLPIISHYEGDTGGGGCGANECNLNITHCDNASCSSSTTTEIEDADDVGQYSSIAIGTDGLPVIAHYNVTGGNLQISKCANTSCTSLSSDTEISDAGNAGENPSIAIGTDGLPIISHRNSAVGLQVTKCANAACTIQTSYGHPDVNSNPFYTSMAIGADGLPVISLHNNATGNLKISKCANSACSSLSSDTEISDADHVGWYSSIAIGTDGLPIIAHYNSTGGNLQITKCADLGCSSASSSKSLSSGVTLGTASSSFQSVYFDTLNLGKEGARVSLNQDGNFYANNLFSSSTGGVSIGTGGASASVRDYGLSSKKDVAAGTTPGDVATGDFNADGRPDVVTVNNGAASASVYYGTSTGISSPASQTLTAGSGAFGVAVGDFNADGKADVIITNLTANTASVYINTGSALPTTATSTLTGLNSPYSVAVGDFNADTKADAIITNFGAGTASVFINSGTALPTTATSTLTTGASPFGVAVADFSNDSKADAVVCNQGAGTCSLYINSGAALPTTATATLTAGANARTVSTGDFNGDSRPDIIIGNFGTSTASVFINTAGASPYFTTGAATYTLSGNNNPGEVGTGDYNGDGRIDAIVVIGGTGRNSAYLYINTGTALPTNVTVNLPTGLGGFGVANGDFNLDGKSDVVIGNQTSNTVSVFMQSSGATLDILGNSPDNVGQIIQGSSGQIADILQVKDSAENRLFAVSAAGVAQINYAAGNAGGSQLPGLIVRNTLENAEITLDPGGTGNSWTLSADDGSNLFRILQNTTTQLAIDGSGNVGIATGNNTLGSGNRDGKLTVESAIGTNSITTYLTGAGTGGTNYVGRMDPNNSTTSYFLYMQSNGGADNEFTVRGDGQVLADNGFTGPADLAEYFYTSDTSLSAGDLVTISDAQSKDGGAVSTGTVRAANNTDIVTGVVSTRPGFLGALGNDTSNASTDYEHNANYKPIGLIGQVPVKVTNKDGAIVGNTPIAISDIPKFGSRAIKNGVIVGRSLESLRTAGCFAASSVDAIVWPVDADGTNAAKPCYVLPDGTIVGKVLTYVKTQYYVPDTNVQGSVEFDTLAVLGQTSLGSLNVSGATTLVSLTVTGDAVIEGKLTVESIVVGDITVGGHIITAGELPTAEVLGASTGQTPVVVVEGNDTLGTITFTTGSTPSTESIKITFNKTYGAAPRVLVSPANMKASGIQFFRGDTTVTDFMLNFNTPLEPNTTYKFDYFTAQ